MLKKFSQFTLLILIVLCFLALKPEELGEPLSLITPLIDNRDYKGAIDRLQDYAKSSSGLAHRAEVYYLIGSINHEYTHNYDQALQAYQQVADLNKKSRTPSDLEPYAALSRMSIAGIYRRMGRYDDAVKVYRKVSEDYSGSGYDKIAVKSINVIEEALAEIDLQKRIIGKYPNTDFAAEAQFEIAEQFGRSIQNPEKAIQEYTKLVSQYPDSRSAAEAQLRIGDTYRTQLNKPEEAISAYEKLIQGTFSTSKLEAEAFFRIGRIYYDELHDYSKALEIFTRFQKNHPTYWKFPAAVYWQGMCYDQLKDYDGAIRTFELFVRLYPDSTPDWLADIGKLGERNVKERIEARVDELKKLAPEAQWNTAERFRSREMYLEALNAYRELARRYPDSQYAQKAGIQTDELKTLAEIQIYRDRIQANSVGKPAAQYRIAEIYETEMQDYTRAVEEYEKVVANYPDTHWSADALYRMGIIYSAEGDSRTRKGPKPNYKKAVEKYQQLIRKYPETYTAAEGYYQMGEIYRTHFRDYKKALEAYGKVVNDYPKRNLYVGEGYKDSLADQAQFRIGRIYYENLQDSDMALRTFSKFLKDYPDSCRKTAAYSFIAAIQEKREDRKAAVYSLEQIIDIIVDSDVQSSFFVREALYKDEIEQSDPRGFDLQRDIIKQIRHRLAKLQGQN